MASGFIFCPNCGTSSTLAGQKFCATCGATLPEAAAAAAPAAAAAAPAAWGAAQPPVQPPAQAPAWGATPPPAQPPAWGATPPPAQPPAWGGPPPGSMQPWGMQTPPPARNSMLMPAMLIVGGLLILALIGVGVILATGSKGNSGTPAPSSAPSVVAQASPSADTSTPTPGKTAKATPLVTPTPPTSDNSVVITPDTASCSGASVNMAFAWKLSGSLPGSTKVVVEFDGSVAGTLAAISSIMTKSSDGNWHSNGKVTSTDACTALGVGDHTVGLQDSTDTVLVEGTFTLTD